jgi:methyl-accepting chemotaxis protein
MEDLPTKLLSQATDNIQKLFDITTRIDEKVKSTIEYSINLEIKIQKITEVIALLKEANAVLNFQDIPKNLENIETIIAQMQNKISHIEKTSEGFKSKWDTAVKFLVQIIWLVVGAWILFKLHLGPPNLP